MRACDFDFILPREAIAQHPVHPRDAARLLLVGARLEDSLVRQLPQLLRPGDLLVLNDTRVLPCRLFGRRGAVAAEVTLVEPSRDGAWRALARPGRRLRIGDVIDFAPELAGRVLSKAADGSIVIDFARSGDALLAALDVHGSAPLPPYIHRTAPHPEDREDYQTIFASKPGAVAAPTAGLHFTADLLSRLQAAGIESTAITLHVGAGTFLPVKDSALEDHVMHAERGEIGDEAAASITACRARGGRIITVGTTVLRLLETAADEDGVIRAWQGETRLFITPGFRFRTADLLMTNFHLPRSTLFMLVCAFAGTQRMRDSYGHALAGGYRFYSYGDACLLERSGE